MNSIPLARLIEGIIQTMRTNVIPNIGDAYARGQAVGVIDLLNNLAPRIDWASDRLDASIAAKYALLDEVARLVPEVVSGPGEPDGLSGAERKQAELGHLDAAICDTAVLLWPRRDEPGKAEALALILAHLHDEASNEMRTTRKPLFAEIASGKG